MPNKVTVRLVKKSKLSVFCKSSKITVRIKSKPKISVFIKASKKLSVNVGSVKFINGDNPIYKGPYIVTPKAHKTTELYTKNKLLVNDVTILEIPYFEASNEFGNTVYIGNEVDINA